MCIIYIYVVSRKLILLLFVTFVYDRILTRSMTAGKKIYRFFYNFEFAVNAGINNSLTTGFGFGNVINVFIVSSTSSHK